MVQSEHHFPHWFSWEFGRYHEVSSTTDLWEKRGIYSTNLKYWVILGQTTTDGMANRGYQQEVDSIDVRSDGAKNDIFASPC
jgi:hypothetical protein